MSKKMTVEDFNDEYKRIQKQMTDLRFTLKDISKKLKRLHSECEHLESRAPAAKNKNVERQLLKLSLMKSTVGSIVCLKDVVDSLSNLTAMNEGTNV